MYRPTNHRTPPPHKNPHNRMHLHHRPLRPAPPNHPILPAIHLPLPHQRRHRSNDRQACRYGCSFEVLAFPGGVFGEGGDGDVEAREAGEAAEDEEGEEERVDGGAQAEGEGADGGGDAEGDLWVGRRELVDARVW